MATTAFPPLLLSQKAFPSFIQCSRMKQSSGNGTHHPEARSCRSKVRTSIRAAAARPTSTRTEDACKVRTVPETDPCKGWTGITGMPVEKVISRFEALAVLVSDRVEMHSILALQRDNWNRLFHSTITIASVSTATASAMNGAAPGSGLQVIAIILGVGAAALMALVSKLQPSQLAEEQRHAARFFRRLGADIEGTLQVDPRLREDAFHYWEHKVTTLHALDKAFPLPLTPIVVEKFPKQVHVSKLNGNIGSSRIPRSLSQDSSLNGWTTAAVEDLKRTSQLLHTSDVPTYVEMAKNAKNINLLLSIVSPLLAAAGALLNLTGMSSVAAAVTVGSLFTHTMTHALQMGAVYEVYRNCAGYYADVEDSIEEALSLPAEKREDATVFLHKISLLLGRRPGASSIVPVREKTAGILF